MTPHISAKKGEIEKVVLMPGDPLRAKFIAENYLTDAKLVSAVRGNLFYTGTYKGKSITVGSSGMGSGSMCIYAYELYNVYGVENIIRLGTTGGLSKETEVGKIVVLKESYTDRTYLAFRNIDKHVDTLTPDKETTDALLASAKNLGHDVILAKAYGAGVFYGGPKFSEMQKNCGVDCSEMESFALFANAIRAGKKAACILTVSNNIIYGGSMPPEEREKGLRNMIEIALDAAVACCK